MMLSELGERSIINNIRKIYDYKWIDDDCSYFLEKNKYLLITVDSISKSMHIPDPADPVKVGYFIAAITLSDIAAMGGVPKYFMSALTLPKSMKIKDLEKIESGIAKCLDKYNTMMIGGDCKEGAEMVISGIGIGEVSKKKILKRDGMNVGDILCVTNYLGKNSAGYYLWKLKNSKEGAEKLLEVEPRIKEGLIISRHGATAAMDLSDGIYSSVAQLKKITGLGFFIDFSKIPVSPFAKKVNEELGVSIEELTLNYGGDYELLFTIPPEKWRVLKNYAEKNNFKLTEIGYVKKGKNMLLKDGKEHEIKERGYEHFT
ncbi:MAG: thiamine-phosphate kinase [Thermoplasmata archaeon]